MDLLNNLAVGFATALSLQNLLYCFLGVTLGTMIGVLPGLGPVATLAMLLPITYTLDPTSALIMLAGIYYGSQYGGSTTAILVNLPGESASVVTCLDGYQMARHGKAGTALGIAAIGSFIAGCFATILVAAFAPPLIELAFKFGPAEYFSLMVLGLVGAVVLANGSVLKAFAMIILGLLLGIIGADVNSGTFRFDIGIAELQDGKRNGIYPYRIDRQLKCVRNGNRLNGGIKHLQLRDNLFAQFIVFTVLFQVLFQRRNLLLLLHQTLFAVLVEIFHNHGADGGDIHSRIIHALYNR